MYILYYNLQRRVEVRVTYGGFIKGILRGVRCTKSLRVLFLHRRPPPGPLLYCTKEQYSSLMNPPVLLSTSSCTLCFERNSWEQKRFIYKLLTRHGCLPVWLVAAWYSSGSGHGPTWTSRREMGVLKKLSLAGIAKLSRLKYRWLRFVWPKPTIGWCTQPANSQLILQSSMKYLGLAGLA